MFNQSFVLTDIPKVLLLAFIEIALSADNAIVLGMFTKNLPLKLKKKALLIGAFSSFCVRLAALIAVGLIIHYRWIQGVGGAYLLFISIRYLCFKKELVPKVRTGIDLWKIIVLIEAVDLIFAFDSILAGVAFIRSSDPGEFASKIWIVYIGGMIGLLGVRLSGTFFGAIIHKFPKMEKAAHFMIGWIGIRLIVEIFVQSSAFEFSFWGVLGMLIIFGLIHERPRTKS